MGASSSSDSEKGDFVPKLFNIPSTHVMPGNKLEVNSALREVRQMLEYIQQSACNSPDRRAPQLEKKLMDRVIEKRGDCNLASAFVTEEQLQQIFKNDPQHCNNPSGRLFPKFSKQWEEQLKARK